MGHDFPTDEQAREMVKFLSNNVNKPLSLRKIHSIYIKSCAHNGDPVVLYETIRTWISKNVRPGRHSGSFYRFVLSDPFASGFQDPERSFVDGATKLFQSKNSIQSSHLTGLTNRHPDNRLPDRGKFYIIRKHWYPRVNDEYLRGIVWFENNAGIFNFFEKQDFKSDYHVYEEYKGYAFNFGSSVWVMAHEKNSRAVKFMTIHDCHPPLSEDAKVNVCKGNLIAVSGRGPNLGHRFVLRRINPGQPETCSVSTKNIIDKDDLDYLNSDYGI